MNRAQRRSKLRRREHNTALTMAKAKWVHDAAHELERERQRQRDMWIACVACNAAFGIGSKRIYAYLNELVKASEEWAEMAQGADEEYADEKLRLKLEQVCGVKIPYLFDDEEQKAKEAACDATRT
ncbi:MAG: hypothetical protein Q4F79_01870 [Eubacteriales bacterium]|nr:hypothetical protein [Eubacteriales bacterium]